MVTNNKVLTVSYGTFSCTLEGFEESFDTMKAIAEYFRDLAADDRYFGAEPPTPDAEMLARIAEKEIARRVEARQESGSIVLRADHAPAPVAPAVASEAAQNPTLTQPLAPAVTAAASASVAEAPVAPAIEAEMAEAPVSQPSEDVVAEDAPAGEEDQAEEAAIDAPIDSVASLVGQAIEESAAAEAIEETVEEAETPAEAHIEEEPAVEVEALAEVEVEALAEVEVEAEVEQAASDAADIEDVLVEDIVAEEVAPAPAPAADENSVAAKLQRIRAVVSQSVTAAPQEDVYLEDQHAEDMSDEAAAADPAAAPIEEAFEAEDGGEALAEDTVAAAPSENTVAERAPRPVRVVRMKRAAFDAAVASGTLEEDKDDAPEAQPESSLSPQDEADLLRELAAVEAEFAEDDEDLTDPEDVRSIFAEDEPAEIAPGPTPEPAPEVAAKQVLQDPDVGRLMDRAEDQMENGEGTERRNAIRHMRAAVEATRAETEAGGGLKQDDGQAEAFRQDLISAVRPSRPIVSKRDTARPAAAAAPLKLVAEQRVDDPAPQAQAPAAEATAQPVVAVRPRRVSPRRVTAAAAAAGSAAAEVAEALQPTVAEQQPAPAAPAPQAEGFDSFADFAESVGASELPDVLEAAASYMSHVEGREQFSRPQLMNKARQLENVGFTREDGLRSFGMLLRQGKIEKLSGGQFSASDLIGFKPNKRAAG